MKKMLLLATLVTIALSVTGCGSLRTPAKGNRKGNVYYHTFFGLSIESGAYGDGFILNDY